MQPIWQDSDFGNNQLYNVYSGIMLARKNSSALRSSIDIFYMAMAIMTKFSL